MSQPKESNDLQDIHNYDVLNIIGTGSFGTCYKVKHKLTNKYYVWKAVDYGSMSLQNKKLLVTEVNLIGTLKHPHIVQYFGRIIHQSSGTLYIIMEWCEGGDLNSLINNCKTKIKENVCEKFIWKVLYQTAKALEACHSLLNHVTVLHRDIKPANIFLDKDYNVKLGDFGLAKILLNNVNFSSTVVGTPYYMSPEQIHGSKYNKKTDVWSLGCLIFELCSLNQPFNGNNLTELKENIAKNRLSRIPTIYSDYLDKMVKLLLSSHHEFRPSVEMIIHHPTVICNYDKNATPFRPVNASQNSDEYSRRSLYPKSPEKRKKLFAEEHIDNIIGKIEKLSDKTQQLSLESDPRAITEEVYNRKLISRLKLLREKESVLKAKEDSLKTKEYWLKSRESSLIHKQKLIERREKEIVLATGPRLCGKLKNERPRLPSTTRAESIKIKKERKCIDLDSTTCSADPGDTSIYPTAVKLDPSKIIKPSFFKHRLKLVSDSDIVNPKVTYDLYGSGDCTRSIQIDSERQPLSLLYNCAQAHRAQSFKHKSSVKKYQNYLYKK